MTIFPILGPGEIFHSFAVDLDWLYFAAVVFNAVPYLAFLLTAILALRTLFRHRKELPLFSYMFGATCLTLMLNTTGTILRIVCLTVELGAARSIYVLSTIHDEHIVSLLFICLYATNVGLILVLDIFMIYRCFVIFHSTIFTVTLLVASLGAAIAGAVSAHLLFSLVYTAASRVWEWIYVASSLVVSLVACGSIIARLWLTVRRTACVIPGGSSLAYTLRIFIESASLQVIVLLGWTTCVLLDAWLDPFPFTRTISRARNGAEAMAPPLLGIAFCLLIIRIGQGRTITPKTIELPEIECLVLTLSTLSTDLEGVQELEPRHDLAEVLREQPSQEAV